MLVPQRWHTEDHFRLVASHRVMPSLCPLPSALNMGGGAILLPWEESCRKRGSALVLVTVGLGLKYRFLLPKPLSWHLGIPGARQQHPVSSLPERGDGLGEIGGGGGGWGGSRNCPQSLAVPQEMTRCLCHVNAEPTAGSQ